MEEKEKSLLECSFSNTTEFSEEEKKHLLFISFLKKTLGELCGAPALGSRDTIKTYVTRWR